MFAACEKARARAADWPAHIFVPQDEAMVELPATLLELGGQQALDDFGQYALNEMLLVVAAGLTWASWRMTQGIYRFDPALYPHLIHTEGSAEIPASMLMQLPEWCVYIETPGLTIPTLMGNRPDTNLYGAWLRLDVDNDAGGAPVLFITLDSDLDEEVGVQPTQMVYLGGSVADGVRASIKRVQAELGHDYDADFIEKKMIQWIGPVVNLALYLCAAPEFSRNGQAATPANPSPKKTKRGTKLFAADGPAVWDVGVRIGSALRAAYQREQAGGDAAGDGHQVRPHMRRAHWHTVVSGKRKAADGSAIPPEKRRRELRWMPPIAVNVDDLNALPAVVRKVK
jgi:hypothetical protein